MKLTIPAILLSSAILLTLSGCGMKNQDIGTIAGGGAGAAIGAVASSGNPWVTVGGAVAGGVAGHYIGKNADKK